MQVFGKLVFGYFAFALILGRGRRAGLEIFYWASIGLKLGMLSLDFHSDNDHFPDPFPEMLDCFSLKNLFPTRPFFVRLPSITIVRPHYFMHAFK
jgi:hypothetical protein